MQSSSIWRRVLGVEQSVIIETVEYDPDDDVVIAHVRLSKKFKPRCGVCQDPAPGYDSGEGRRRWRTLDLGSVETFLESDAPRVKCRIHGVTVAWVPWARHGAGHTTIFDEQTAWLATVTSKSAARELMRVAWRTIGVIITRVWGETAETIDLFAGVTRIGVDEISYKKRHKYLTIVVDHDTGRLLWASPGRDKNTLRKFFDALEESGAGRCAKITHVTADGADWIADVIAERCPHAIRCADPFHVVKWATDALDSVRREVWNDARREARTEPARGRGRPPADAPARPASERARGVKNSRYALWKNPDTLTERQTQKLEWIAKTSPKLHRAYLLKEGLRLVFKLPAEEAAEALDRWITWARRSRIDAFVKLQRTIVKHRDRILASIEHGLSNGRIESVNQKIRLITRVSFGFKSPDPLIGLAMLTLGGHKPTLPGR